MGEIPFSKERKLAEVRNMWNLRSTSLTYLLDRVSFEFIIIIDLRSIFKSIQKSPFGPSRYPQKLVVLVGSLLWRGDLLLSDLLLQLLFFCIKKKRWSKKNDSETLEWNYCTDVPTKSSKSMKLSCDGCGRSCRPWPLLFFRGSL